jgi:hypothetical protein
MQPSEMRAVRVQLQQALSASYSHEIKGNRRCFIIHNIGWASLLKPILSRVTGECHDKLYFDQLLDRVPGNSAAIPVHQ